MLKVWNFAARNKMKRDETSASNPSGSLTKVACIFHSKAPRNFHTASGLFSSFQFLSVPFSSFPSDVNHWLSGLRCLYCNYLFGLAALAVHVTLVDECSARLGCISVLRETPQLRISDTHWHRRLQKILGRMSPSPVGHGMPWPSMVVL